MEGGSTGYRSPTQARKRQMVNAISNSGYRPFETTAPLFFPQSSSMPRAFYALGGLQADLSLRRCRTDSYISSSRATAPLRRQRTFFFRKVLLCPVLFTLSGGYKRICHFGAAAFTATRVQLRFTRLSDDTTPFFSAKFFCAPCFLRSRGVTSGFVTSALPLVTLS